MEFLIIYLALILSVVDQDLPDTNVHLNTVVNYSQYRMDMPDIKTCEELSNDITRVNAFCTKTRYYRPYQLLEN